MLQQRRDQLGCLACQVALFSALLLTGLAFSVLTPSPFLGALLTPAQGARRLRWLDVAAHLSSHTVQKQLKLVLCFTPGSLSLCMLCELGGVLSLSEPWLEGVSTELW